MRGCRIRDFPPAAAAGEAGGVGALAQGEGEGPQAQVHRQHHEDGGARARSHCHFVRLPIHFIPDSLTYVVALCLKRQCDRTLGGVQEA